MRRCSTSCLRTAIPVGQSGEFCGVHQHLTRASAPINAVNGPLGHTNRLVLRPTSLISASAQTQAKGERAALRRGSLRLLG